MINNQLKIITLISILLTVSLSVVSILGIFLPNVYNREMETVAVQVIGLDIFNLIIIIPLLVISLLFMYRQMKWFIIILSGIIFYILYTYTAFIFGLHFNNLFLLYCLILGLSFYVLILLVVNLNEMNIISWFNDKVPIRAVRIYFITIAIIFYMVWLSDILPAVINNSIPKAVSKYDFLVNPIHVLDIAFALPGLIITSKLLKDKNPLGYIFTPIFLIYLILLPIALLAMVIMSKINNFQTEVFIKIICAIFALFSIGILFFFLRSIKTHKFNAKENL